MEEFLASDFALDRFIEGFEAGLLAKSVWTHTAHVAMAADYCLRFDQQEAEDRARDCIRRLNQCFGNRNTDESGYHETLTIFWLVVIRAFLTERAAGLARLESVRLAADTFGPQRDLFKDYYSFDVAASREARARWIRPDVIDFPNR